MVSPGFDFLFQERFLLAEVVLLAEKAGHATFLILKATNWGAFCRHPSNIESAFLQDLLEAFCLASVCCHFLWLPTKVSTRIIHWNYCILLFSLFPPIRLVHVKRAESIQPERGMGRGLVENKERNALWMRLLKDSNGLINLNE